VQAVSILDTFTAIKDISDALAIVKAEKKKAVAKASIARVPHPRAFDTQPAFMQATQVI
jgi:hypothetical protein